MSDSHQSLRKLFKRHAEDELTLHQVAEETDEESAFVPKGAVRGAKQINRGESVSRQELLDGLSELSDSDAGD